MGAVRDADGRAPFTVLCSTSCTAATPAFRPMRHGPTTGAHGGSTVSSRAHQEEKIAMPADEGDKNTVLHVYNVEVRMLRR